MTFEFTIGPLPLITKQIVPAPLSLPVPAVPSARPPHRAEDAPPLPLRRAAAAQELS